MSVSFLRRCGGSAWVGMMNMAVVISPEVVTGIRLISGAILSSWKREHVLVGWR